MFSLKAQHLEEKARCWPLYTCSDVAHEDTVCDILTHLLFVFF